MGVTLYVFGNEYLAEDSLAALVARQFKDVQLVYCKSPDDLLDAGDEMAIIDVVKGISDPILITDVDQLKTRNLMSLHDFDLGFFLNLLKGMGMEKKIKIIGIPEKGDAKSMYEQVRAWI
ncbi:MAG: hypothetical protein ABIJ21_03050 [Nanoarchaeota archaeon]